MFCLNCYSEFDKNDILYERNDGVIMEYCPHCKRDSIIEVYHHCDNCGNVCSDDYIETADGGYYCSDCYKIKQIGEVIY